jgi:hypothetical protein
MSVINLLIYGLVIYGVFAIARDIERWWLKKKEEEQLDRAFIVRGNHYVLIRKVVQYQA